MKIGIIGSGISGLSVARMLQDAGHEVVIFEKNDKEGGLIKCARIDDSLFHLVGGHVFNSRNERVLDWFWSHFDREKEFVKARRNAKVFYGGKLIGYPIENYLYLLDKSLVQQIVGELLELQKKPAKAPLEYPDFETFLRNNFGDTLYTIYFGPYNQKIWQTDLSTVSMAWLEGKLPMPNYKDVLLSNIVREEEKGMVHAHFYYPKEDGSQFIVNRLKKGITIRTNELVNDFESNGGQYIVQGEKGFDRIIYCGDVRRLPLYCQQLLEANGVDFAYIQQLKSNGTSNLFCETDDTDISWLYIPEGFTKAHRIIYTGNFSDSNNRGSERKTCVVEFSGKVEYETMEQEIKKLPGNLKPLSWNYEPSSYVVQDIKTRPAIAAAKATMEKKGIYLLGRFAEWEYYNMDKCIEAAFDIVARL